MGVLITEVGQCNWSNSRKTHPLSLACVMLSMVLCMGFVVACSGDGTATVTAAPLFTAEINNSLVINYNCNRNVFDLRQLLLALLFKQDGCEF